MEANHQWTSGTCSLTHLRVDIVFNLAKTRRIQLHVGSASKQSSGAPEGAEKKKMTRRRKKYLIVLWRCLSKARANTQLCRRCEVKQSQAPTPADLQNTKERAVDLGGGLLFLAVPRLSSYYPVFCICSFASRFDQPVWSGRPLGVCSLSAVENAGLCFCRVELLLLRSTVFLACCDTKGKFMSLCCSASEQFVCTLWHGIYS